MWNYSSLDLSYNLIKRIPEELEKHLTSLKTVFFVQNKISHIENLAGFAATLRSLELGGNRIRVSDVDLTFSLRTLSPTVFQQIEGLEALVNLEELWLGKNKITKLEVGSAIAKYVIGI